MSQFEKNLLRATQKPGFLTRAFSKADYFDGPVPAIQSEAVMERIDDVLEMLALRREFITEREWMALIYQERHNASLNRIAGKRGAHLEIINGYVCNERIMHLLPHIVHYAPLDSEREHRAANEAVNIRFWDYCEREDYTNVHELALCYDVDVNFAHKSSEMLTPLDVAISRNASVPGLLLQLGANPDSRTLNQMTPLMQAAKRGLNQLAKELVDRLALRYHDEPEKLIEALTVSNQKTGLTAYLHACMTCDPPTARYIRDALEKAVRRTQKKVPSFLCDDPNDYLVQRLKGEISLATPRKDKDGVFRQAITAGLLGEALESLKRNGMQLPKSLLVDEQDGITDVFVHICQSGQLPVLFAPENWVGRVKEMRECWEQLPTTFTEEMDKVPIRANVQQALALSIRAMQKGRG